MVLADGHAGSTSDRRLDSPITVKVRFDRGTILLTEPPKDLNLGEVPCVLWDSRVGAHRAPASRYAELCSRLRDVGVEFEDITPAPRSSTDAWSAVPLRPYQDAALSAWELARRRGIVALPTGSGKTRLAIDAIRRTGLSALCLVPTRAFCWTSGRARSLRCTRAPSGAMETVPAIWLP